MKLPRTVAAAAVAVLMTSAAPVARSQTPQPQAPAPAGQPQNAIIQQQNEDMLRELRAIRMLLEKLAAPQPGPPAQPASARVANLKGYALGRADAPLTMVEFTDLQCPFCRQYASSTFDEIKKNWIDTGKLRYISRDFPIDFHAMAFPAARAARCAGEQGKFWEMRVGLMRNANLLTPDYIQKAGADLKIDTAAFAACTASTKYDADIQSDIREGTALGVGGTPTFVLGRTTGTSVEGPVIVGAQPYTLFDARLRSLLGGDGK